MPRIGNVEVSDDVIASLQRGVAARTAASTPRPGIGEIFGAAARGAYGQVRYGVPYEIAKLSGDLTPQDEAFYQRGLAAAGTAAGRAPAASVDDVLSGRVGVGRAIVENLTSSLPYMVGGIAGAAAGGLAGSVVPGLGTGAGAIGGAIVGGTPQFLGSNVARAVETEGSLSQEAAERSLLTAPLQSAADAAIGRFLPGAGKVLGDMAATQAGGFLRRTATSMLKAAGTEAVTEAAQQVGERYAAGLDLGDADAAGEYVNAAATAFVLGGVLGSGGGFRRSDTVAKPAEQVTTQDTDAHVDGILNGTLRALPAPADFIARPDGTTEVNPSGRSQLLLPPPERFAQPDALGDTAGNVALNPDAERQLMIERNRPQVLENTFIGNVTPDIRAILEGRQPPAAEDQAPNVLAQPAPVLPRSETSPAALSGVPVGETPQVELPAQTRPFQDVDMADLRKARGAKNADPEIVAAIDAELEARKTDDPFMGVRLNQDIAKLRGAPIEDVRAGVTALLESGDDRASTFQLAERLGIDVNAPGATVEDQTLRAQSQPVAEPGVAGADTAPAPSLTRTNTGSGDIPASEPSITTPRSPARVSLSPAEPDPAFQAEWAQLKKDAGIQRNRTGGDTLGLTPANLTQARAQVMQGLADELDLVRGNREGDQGVGQIEKLARKMGLVTDDNAMDITPLGRQAYLSTPAGLEETTAAAGRQGYSGVQASRFEQGVRAALGASEEQTFSDFADMAAYQAGKVWAQDFAQNGEVKTAAQTTKIQERLAARQPAARARQYLDPETGEVRAVPAGLSDAQVRQQGLNNLLDMADLSGVADTDVAELRRLVRGGAAPEEVGAALQQVQGGQTLFRQPEAAPASFTPATVVRGQPRFKEMYDPAENTPQKAQQRAESEAAVQAYDLRNLVEFAKAEGGITEARAAKLHDLLDQGKTEQVRGLLKDFDPDAAPTQARRRLPTPPERVDERAPGGLFTGGADAAFEAAIDGKDLDGVFDHMIAAAPSKYHREVMRKIKGLSSTLRKAGVEIGLQVVRPGDTAPVALNDPSTRAYTVSKLNPPSSQVYLKSSAMGGASGMNYQLAAHELLHAVTDRLVDYGRKNPNSKIGKDVKDLIDLRNAVVGHFNARVAEGNLSEFEQAYYQRQTNALANIHELISWGMTNPDMQRYLQSIEYKPRQSVFGRLVELLRNLLGLDGKYDTALTELLRVSERVLKPGTNDLTSAYAMNNPQGFAETEIDSPALEAAPKTAQAANELTQTVAARATEMLDRVTTSNVVQNARDIARRVGLGLYSRNHIDQTYGDIIPGLLENTAAKRSREAVRNKLQLVGENVVQRLEKLRQSKIKQDREDAKRINRLMMVAQYGIDGAKTWDEQTHLHGEPNAERLKEIVADARDDYSNLARHQTVGLFEEARAANEAQNLGHMLGQLYETIANDPQYAQGVAGGAVSPADALIDAEGITSASQARAFLEADLERRLQAAKDYIAAQGREAAAGTDRQRADSEVRLSSLQALIGDITKNRAIMAERPYFHLPRFGDHFAAFSVVKDGKEVDRAALQKVAEAVAELGVGDVQLSTDNTNPRVMIRTDSKSTAAAMGRLGLDLERRGLVEKGSTLFGPRTREDNFGLGGRVPDYLAQALEKLDSDPTFTADSSLSRADKEQLAKQLAAAKQALVDGWLDMQPDNSLSKVLAKRKNVQGAATDMIRGFAHRQNVGAIGISALMTRPKFAEALRTMRATVEESVQADSALDPYMVKDVVNEVRRRELESPVNEAADAFDKLRATSHAFYLGLNPSSALINMTALGTTVLPELAKKSGYARSFHAMRRASADAAKILSAAFADAQSRELGHKADLSLTEDVLRKSGISEDVRAFVRKRVADGDIDLGTMSRALGQVASGKSDTALDHALSYGSAFNLYSEAFARLVAVIAARDLHGSGNTAEAHDYARQVVKDSLFEFQPSNTARQFGKQGILGPVTPLVTQFMQWNLQVTEKLFREFRDATGRQRPGESAASASARRAAAQKFLVGHLTAMTALAGTLGLPFATVFATALEALVGDDDEPFDATASWRNLLAQVFGKDMGEVLARGLPRAAGFDISQRAGEANLLPFSEFLADKRSWREAVADNVGRGIGAAPNMLVSVLDGGSKIADGDLLGGMKEMLPVALKSPLETYRMASEGYIDTKGNKLPLTPGGRDILWQLLGFSPAAKAEYSEARQDQAARRGELGRRSAQLRSGIIRALMANDTDGARSLIADAMQFDEANPAFAVIPSVSSTLASRQQAAATAQALKVPVGVSMRDVAGQQMTGYANF